MKFVNNTIDKIITRLGQANDSEITTAILAGFKLVFVPFATLNDKKSTKEEKAYALKRDLTTESIALLGYLGVTNVAKNNLTAPICSKYYKNFAKKLSKNNLLDSSDEMFKQLTNVDKTALKKNANDILSLAKDSSLTKQEKTNLDNLTNTIKSLNSKIASLSPKQKELQMPSNLYLNTKKNLSHVCVLTLALSIIPFLTNKMMKVVNIKKEFQKQDPVSFDDVSPKYTNLKPMNLNQYKNFTKTGVYNVIRY